MTCRPFTKIIRRFREYSDSASHFQTNYLVWICSVRKRKKQIKLNALKNTFNAFYLSDFDAYARNSGVITNCFLFIIRKPPEKLTCRSFWKSEDDSIEIRKYPAVFYRILILDQLTLVVWKYRQLSSNSNSRFLFFFKHW